MIPDQEHRLGTRAAFAILATLCGWPDWWLFLSSVSNVLPNPEPVRTEEG